MTIQPSLLDVLESPPVREAPSGRQHTKVLLALLDAKDRGLTGEEAAQRCGIRLASSATTRMEELADRERFGVPLVAKTDRKRPTASGRLASVWTLTDVGRATADELRRA